MTMKLYSEESVRAIADAIRTVDGSSATMKIGDMAAKITPLLKKQYREVWLHAPTEKSGELYIDTGVAGDLEHTIEVVGYGNLYSSSTLFGSVTSTSSRQVIDLLTSSNKFRIAWGNSGLKTYEYPISTISVWRPFKVRVNKSGITINGFTQGGGTSTTLTASLNVTDGASTANYWVFPKVSNAATGGDTGVFRSAKIYDATDTLIHDLVPIMYNDFSLALLDKVTDEEQVIASGTNGFEGYWAPFTDKLLDLGD